MNKPGLTVQMMVRNEEWTVWESIMSTVPFAQAAVIVDTGSTDDTVKLIEDAISRIPNVPIKFLKLGLPEQSSWTLVDGSSPHPSRDLGEVRNLMRDLSDTRWLWTVDADEVYLPESAKYVGEYLSGLLPEVVSGTRIAVQCVYVPILWTGHDPSREATAAEPATYGFTGRLFRNDLYYVHANYDLTHKYHVMFPGEAAHYFIPKYSHWRVPIPSDPNCRAIGEKEMPPVLHYEMASKPWRRVAVNDKPITWPVPAEFEQRKAIFGKNLFTVHEEKLLLQKANTPTEEIVK